MGKLLWFLKKHKKDDQIKRHLLLIEWMLRRLTKIVVLGFARLSQEPKGQLRFKLHFTKESAVPNPPVVLTSEQKLPIGITPIKPDGTEDMDVDIVWSSSDPSVGIEEQEDGRSAVITTPGETGSATITASAPGYTDEQIDVSYAPPVKGKLNLTIGVPVSDL